MALGYDLQFKFSIQIAVMVTNSTRLKLKSSENRIMWIFNFCNLIQNHSICPVQQSGRNENMKNRLQNKMIELHGVLILTMTKVKFSMAI